MRKGIFLTEQIEELLMLHKPDKQLLFFPERLEDDVQEEGSVELLQVLAKQVEQLRRGALLRVEIDPIER